MVRIVSALVLVLALSPMAARSEVTDRSVSGFQVQRVVTIAADQERVRAALFDVGRWWNSAHSYSRDARNLSIDIERACFCEKLPTGWVRHMAITAVNKNGLTLFGGLGPLQSTGAAGHMNWRIKAGETPSTSTLTVTYDVGGYAKGGLAETWAAPVDFVIGEQVDRLKSYIETGAPQ